jgi:hypothetical protein
MHSESQLTRELCESDAGGHDEAISGSHRLHRCDNDVAKCRLDRGGRHLTEWQLRGEQRRLNSAMNRTPGS